MNYRKFYSLHNRLMELMDQRTFLFIADSPYFWKNYAKNPETKFPNLEEKIKENNAYYSEVLDSLITMFKGSPVEEMTTEEVTSLFKL